jgi:ABC-type branched-subunit amino acid transport system ATPase component
MTDALELNGVSVSFGGLKAVRDVSLTAPRGRITGLIGANGAGKTTMFNACTGIVPTVSGSVRYAGRRLDGLSTAQRAQLGLGRTFQRVELIDVLSVRENVAVGAEALAAGGAAWGFVGGRRGERARILRVVDVEIDRCGLGDLADVPAALLSTGQARLVELARALAAGYPFLLLDEPSSGLDKNETEQFGRIVMQAVVDRALGILVVEHDMALVRQICDYVYALDFGQIIIHGAVGEVLNSDAVRAAYLGSEAAGQVA